MRIYVAGPFIKKSELKGVADVLKEEGFHVVSRWHDIPPKEGENSREALIDEALMDWADINVADTLLYLNLSKSEGKATELGIALAKGLKIYVVGGKQNNVFLHLPQVSHFELLEDAMSEFAKGTFSAR